MKRSPRPLALCGGTAPDVAHSGCALKQSMVSAGREFPGAEEMGHGSGSWLQAWLMAAPEASWGHWQRFAASFSEKDPRG